MTEMTNQALIDSMVVKAREALKVLETYTQEQIDELCKACCLAFAEEAEAMAIEAVEETGLGNVPDKIMKNQGSPDGVWYAIKDKKTVGVIGEDKEHHLKLVAHPKGIIACIPPTTNPNITVLFNGIYALKGRNVVICSPHPRSKKSSMHTVEIFNRVLKEHGAPDNVFQIIENPSTELSQMMMAASDVVLGTGGPGMVKAAYSSGKPAYGVGPGNSQTVIDPEYDNLDQAIGDTLFANRFDNGIICACNRSIIAPKAISAAVVEKLKADPTVCYIDDEAVRDKAREYLFPNGRGPINGAPVGQDAMKLAEMMGIEVPEGTLNIVLKVEKYGDAEPLCREKMYPLAVLIEAEDLDDAIQIAKANLLYEGAGHSSVIFSNNDAVVEKFACELPISRVLVNCPGIFSANPALANGLCPTATLGCGSWAGCSVSENLGYEELINISRVAYVYPENEIPTHDDVWNGTASF